jgi:hypothetical protein
MNQALGAAGQQGGKTRTRDRTPRTR